MTLHVMVDGEWVELPARTVEFTAEPSSFEDAVDASMQSTYTLNVPMTSEAAETLTEMLNRMSIEAWWRRHGWLRAMVSTRSTRLPTCAVRP
jgi:hypothetical protein